MNQEQQKEYEEKMGSPEMERMNYLMEHPEEQVYLHDLSNVKNVPKEVSEVNWEEKMTEPDEFIIRKTQPKEGLPDGAYVCFNHHRLKYTQMFGGTPQDALQHYMEKLIELGK